MNRRREVLIGRRLMADARRTPATIDDGLDHAERAMVDADMAVIEKVHAQRGIAPGEDMLKDVRAKLVRAAILSRGMRNEEWKRLC